MAQHLSIWRDIDAIGNPIVRQNHTAIVHTTDNWEEQPESYG